MSAKHDEQERTLTGLDADAAENSIEWFGLLIRLARLVQRGQPGDVETAVSALRQVNVEQLEWQKFLLMCLLSDRWAARYDDLRTARKNAHNDERRGGKLPSQTELLAEKERLVASGRSESDARSVIVAKYRDLVEDDGAIRKKLARAEKKNRT
jgi:hypothetical protein